jgi:hypothetical protein
VAVAVLSCAGIPALALMPSPKKKRSGNGVAWVEWANDDDKTVKKTGSERDHVPGKNMGAVLLVCCLFVCVFREVFVRT